MHDDDVVRLLMIATILVILVVSLISLTAGSVVSQLLTSFPSAAGPIGAGVSITVFAGILLKLLEILIG